MRTGVVGISPKAYPVGGGGDTWDWRGIGVGAGGGQVCVKVRSTYGGMAEVYRMVAQETILGQERVGRAGIP